MPLDASTTSVDVPELVPIMPPLPASDVSVKLVQPPKSSMPPLTVRGLFPRRPCWRS